MRVEATIAEISLLPAGVIDAPAGELSCRIRYVSPNNKGHVSVRYVAANSLSVISMTKKDEQCISETLQETQEGADN